MKKSLIKLFSIFGAFYFIKFLTRKRPKLLMYHSFSIDYSKYSINIDEFDWQVSEIKKNFIPITLLELSELIKSNKEIPNNTIVLTIDDGYDSFYKLAYPILKKYDVPATFFVTTGFINGDLWLWPDKIKWILRKNNTNKQSITLNNQTFLLSKNWKKSWRTINDYCLTVDENVKQSMIVSLADQLKINIPINPPEQYKASKWKELQEMQDWGIEIGGHTISHPSLTKVTYEQSRVEIRQCLADLNKNLGVKKRTFCYPNGLPEDYDEEIKNIVKQEGFIDAVTAFNDYHNINIPYAWRRFIVDNNKLNFKKTIYGLDDLGNMLKKNQRCDY